MSSQRLTHRALQLSTVLLAIVATYLLSRLAWPVSQSASVQGLTHNYFSPIASDPVAMMYSATAHYRPDAADSDVEFAALLPSGGHLVHIDEDDQPGQAYTVTLFHQFKCLDLIRKDYIASQEPSTLTKHCLTYLRQTILCRPSLGLESTKNSRATAVRTYEAVCKDWTEVYKEAERNHMVYEEWRKKGE